MSSESAEVTADPRPTPLKALGILVGVIVMIAAYITLCTLLGNQEFYVGFIWLLCWSVIEQMKIERLPHSVLGAAGGMALCYLLKVLVTSSLGATGGLIFGALVLPVLYFQMMGWFPLVINFTLMTFLAVLTIPYVQASGNFRDMAIILPVAVAYFGLIIALPTWLASRRAPKPGLAT